jgi:hypothetical protein
MIKTEKMLLEEIMRLLKDLEIATYEEQKPNGLVFPPNANKFYYSAKKLFESTDELIDRFSPEYVTNSDYKFICATQKDILLQLDVLKDNKNLKDMEVTWELENYLIKIQGLFSCISRAASLYSKRQKE